MKSSILSACTAIEAAQDELRNIWQNPYGCQIIGTAIQDLNNLKLKLKGWYTELEEEQEKT